MADDKTFAVGEVLSAADTNEYLVRGYWKRIGRQIIPSGSPVSSVSFSSIESRFRSFRVHTAVNGSSTVIRLNNDSSGNYAYRLYDMDDTAMIIGTGDTGINFSRGAGSELQEVTITKIASNLRAHATGVCSSQFLSTSVLGRNGVYMWNNTSALINRIDIVGMSGTFYGVVAVEGMVGV